MVTAGFVAASVVAAILTLAGLFWVVVGARFADHLAFAVLWPIATVLMVIAATPWLSPSTTCASASCWRPRASPRSP